MRDALDLPHVWTQRQVDAHETRRHESSGLVTRIGAELDIIADRTARRARLEADDPAIKGLDAAVRWHEQQMEEQVAEAVALLSELGQCRHTV